MIRPSSQGSAIQSATGIVYSSSTGIVCITSVVEVVAISTMGVVIRIMAIGPVIIRRVIIRGIIASPAVISITSPAPIIPSVAVTIPPPRVVMSVIASVEATVKSTISPSVWVTAPSPVVIVNVNVYIGWVVSPGSISVVVVIVAIVLKILVNIYTVVLYIRIISVHIGKYFALQNFPIFVGLLIKVIAKRILFGCRLAGPRLLSNPNLFRSIRVNAIVIVI